MEYTIIVTFSNDKTIESLNRGSYALCCFIACESKSYRDGFPLCWSTTTFFSSNVFIPCYDEMIACYSTNTLKEGAVILIPQPATPGHQTDAAPVAEDSVTTISANSKRITLQQRMNISRYGVTTVKSGDYVDSVQIDSESEQTYIAGLGLKAYDENYYGICGFNLYKPTPLRIKPISTAFLAIVPGDTIDQNAAASTLYYDGVTVDLSGLQKESRTVTYDLSVGWSSDPAGSPWMKNYKSPCNLRSILIRNLD